MTLVIFIFLSASTWAQESVELDRQLESYIEKFNYQAIEYPATQPRDLVYLGARLFFEKKLSGNMNISCATCHALEHFTGDALPLALGEGLIGVGDERRQNGAVLLPRHAPHLINIGVEKNKAMFWDGRVSFDEKTHTFKTPDAALDGGSKLAGHLKSALSAQALFPLLSREEMLGDPSENEISALTNSAEIWQALLDRLLYGAQAAAYQNAFLKAFPELSHIEEISIAHVAEAIAAYETHGFLVRETPWDRYLRGEKTALGEAEKRGALIFSEKARCAKCHSGALLTNFEFRNIGIPPVGPGKVDGQDYGHFEVSQNRADRYKFKVPSLRNVALTAPYMHNGAFATLEEVVDHYNHVRHSFMSYQTTLVMKNYGKFYDAKIERVFERDRVVEMFDGLDPEVWPPLFLMEDERADLLLFLRKSLTQESLEFYKPWKEDGYIFE